MKAYFKSFFRSSFRLSAVAMISVLFQASLVKADGIRKIQSRDLAVRGLDFHQPTNERLQHTNYDAYILGPGDRLQIELFDLPELSGNFSIGPDGTIYLPRLRALYVEGLTIEELREFLTQEFELYVHSPIVYIRPIAYRPIRIYIGGEVKRPGYYTLTGVQSVFDNLDDSTSDIQNVDSISAGTSRSSYKTNSISAGSSSSSLFPTVFDAIRTAQGITPYANLAQVQVIRKRAVGQGGGRIKTDLNFISLLTEGNESQNIRLFDGDTLKVGKSSVVLRKQLLQSRSIKLKSTVRGSVCHWTC